MAEEDPSSDVVVMSDVAFAWPGAQNFRISVDAFELAQRSRTLLIGPSGGGKSTLLSLICGIVAPERGRIKILGTEITQLSNVARDRFRAEHFGVIFQMFNLLPYGSVIDNVALPLSFAGKRRQRAIDAGGVQQEARRILEALEIDGALLAGSAAALSVGQQQRVAAARALIGSPEIIVADEPTSALDKSRQERFLDLLFAQADEARTTLVMVSHDEALAPRFDQVLRLADIVHVGGEP